jgi:hypothetical protein
MILVGVVAFATVVGGIGAPWPFLVAMLLALTIALAIVHTRPLRFDSDAARVALPATGVVIGLVGLAFALAAYALMRARLRFLTDRDAASGRWLQLVQRDRAPLPRDPSPPPRGGGVRPVPPPSGAEKPAPSLTRHVDLPRPAGAPGGAAFVAPLRRQRHGPWTRDEIMAGLLIGCRAADERGALLSQRLLRTLAREDPRIPSWSVVDRAARRDGETGGAWLREARRRHRYDGLKAVPGPYGPEADLRETA